MLVKMPEEKEKEIEEEEEKAEIGEVKPDWVENGFWINTESGWLHSKEDMDLIILEIYKLLVEIREKLEK